MNKPKLLLFDLGNVLVQLDLDRFSRTLGVNSTDARSHYGKGVRALTNEYETGKCTTEEYFSSLSKFFDNRFSINDLEKAFASVLTLPMPGMEELVRNATAKLPAALVSNTNEYHFSSVLPRLPALHYLPKRYLSYQMAALKPFPEFYEYIIRRESVQPGEMLFIDDVAENVTAAEQAGMMGFQFDGVERLAEHLKKVGVL